MAKFSRIFFISFIFILTAFVSSAQVSAVTFGKNRVQYKKFKWQYYQTQNFNVYFYAGGQELAKFVAQVAEKELPSIEAAAEYSLQRRANIILYNEFADMQQTNIGLESDLLNTGGVTRLVNNKMVMYYDANHYNLKRQIRQGIADVITKNVLFGDDLGEVASNQALLDLPVWLTDGYVAYLGENWSTQLDDDLKSEILSGNYTKFSKLAYHQPLLTGHAFWYYIEEKYKKENVTYFLYLARVYKNLNKASKQITKLSFKQLQADFMEYQDEKYSNDITRRKYYPKGSLVESFDINKRVNYYRFNVNPVKKNNDYVVTQFKKGIVRLILNTDGENKTILKYGTRSYEAEINPSYPLVAWDPKGTRISVFYTTEGRLKLFVYDVMSNIKQYRFDLTDKFDQVQDVKYMLDSRTLLISAVKNGHADIYTFNIEKEKITPITNDVYDNLDATFVSFPGKTGIIYSSNRPAAEAKTGDTVLPSNNRFNIFLITNFGDKPELNQITQLTNLKYGNARFPTPYNNTHFTFVSDENGIGNRYAGFFTTKAEGLDTLVLIGDDILRNPSEKLVDSTLRAYKKTDVDSVAIVAVSSDSTYIFPLSNYPSSLAESRVAGDNNQVSEVTRQSDEKDLYKLKIDENTLRRRNINATPTEYAKKLMRESKLTTVKVAGNGKLIDIPEAMKDSAKKQDDFFQTEFANEKKDSTKKGIEIAQANNNFKDDENVLARAKLFKYKPIKFSIDYGSGGFSNGVLINRYQAYAGGAGPIRLNNGSPLSGLVRLGTSDLMEDIKINGGYKLGTNLKDNEWLLNYQNLKRRLDWGLTYYRNVQQYNFGTNLGVFPGKEITNLYQVNIAYPFDVTKSIRFSTGVRTDNDIFFAVQKPNISLALDNQRTSYSITHLEFVYDNSINVAQNIHFGARAKIYGDWNRQINKDLSADGPNSFNVGFDARYYHSIFRNFIWAGRVAGDFSFGDQKLIYYLGGMDGWLMFGGNTKKNGNDKYFITNNPPATDVNYAFQSLAVNMRGFLQNIASGSNAFVFNSEFRLPVFTTLLDKTINNAFIRNFQLTQFIDLGTAWNGGFNNIKRPVLSYNTPSGPNQPGPVTVKVKAGGIGPFAGGYGFGARSTLLGYFIKFDAGWQLNGFFRGKPQLYLSLGLDF
jgi:RNA-binding protein YhbY